MYTDSWCQKGGGILRQAQPPQSSKVQAKKVRLFRQGVGEEVGLMDNALVPDVAALEAFVCPGAVALSNSCTAAQCRYLCGKTVNGEELGGVVAHLSKRWLLAHCDLQHQSGLVVLALERYRIHAPLKTEKLVRSLSQVDHQQGPPPFFRRLNRTCIALPQDRHLLPSTEKVSSDRTLSALRVRLAA
jgi:hypothetical protein